MTENNHQQRRVDSLIRLDAGTLSTTTTKHLGVGPRATRSGRMLYWR